MARNVFVLGLDQHNLEILRRLPGAGELAFHRLLSVEELQGEHIDVPVLLDRAVQQLEAFDGPIDAIVSFWDFPMVVMVPILCARYGLPSANLLAVLRCEHKLWARNVQASTLDELPAYGLLDLDIPAPVLPEGVLPRMDQTRQRSLLRRGLQGARRRRAARETARGPRRDRPPGPPLPGGDEHGGGTARDRPRRRDGMFGRGACHRSPDEMRRASCR